MAGAVFVAGGIGPLLAIAALCLLPSAPTMRRVTKRPLLELRPLLRNRALMAYVVAFAGNTWEAFAVRVWFVACLSWTLSLPGNFLPVPALGKIAGLASLAGVPASIGVAELASRYGRRRAIVATCFVSVMVCLALAATAGGPILVVLALLVFVQVTSFADVGALAGGTAAEPSQRGAALALYALVGYTTRFAGPVRGRHCARSVWRSSQRCRLESGVRDHGDRFCRCRLGGAPPDTVAYAARIEAGISMITDTHHIFA